jgi:hypothetical protein
MAIQIQGNGGTTQEVDTTFRAARITIRPMEIIGWYSIAGSSGALTGVAAAGNVFSFRNTGSNPILIRNVYIGFGTTTAFTTAQGLFYTLFKCTGFTVSDSGGTALYTAGNNKHRESFTNITSAPDIRISTTGALTAGTRTVQTQGLGNACGSSTAVGTSMAKAVLFGNDTGDYPLYLAQNEGFVIQNDVLMGAAGVVRLQVQCEFAEVSSY